MSNQPKVSEILLYLIGAVIMGVIAFWPRDNGLISTGFLLAMIAFGVVAIFAGFHWLRSEWLDTLEQYRQVMSISPEQKLAETVSKLTEAQIDLLRVQTPVLRILAGNEGPMMLLQVGEHDVPYSFVRQFMGYQKRDENGLEWLKPIRDHEDTKEINYAKWLTDWLVTLGFALTYAGNHSARWVDKKTAMKWLGLEAK